MGSPMTMDLPTTAPLSIPRQHAESDLTMADILDSRAPAFEVERLSIWYDEKKAIDDVTITIPSKTITAIIGPSGCGKSTFLRSLNRMHELVPRSRIEGKVLFAGEDIYAPDIDPTAIRRRIGMVFQKSNPFP